MQKDCSDKPRFPPQLKKLSKYHVRLLTKRTVSLNQLTFDHWVVAAVVPLVRAIAAMRCHCQLLLYGCHCSCEIHFLCLNTLSGKKRSKLKSSLPSFWQGASDSKWLPGLFTAERHPSVLDCLLSFTMASFSLYWFALTLLLWTWLSALLKETFTVIRWVIRSYSKNVFYAYCTL